MVSHRPMTKTTKTPKPYAPVSTSLPSFMMS